MPVFQDVSLSINPGDRIAVVGPNGAGKTTFLQLLAEALQQASGAITRRRGLRIAVSEQDSRIEGKSGGEHSRAQLLRAFEEDADLLLLDEPTNHLDLRTREWLERTLSRLRAATVVASHDRRFLANFASRVIEIERGKLQVYNSGYLDDRERKQQRVAQQWADYEGFARRGLRWNRQRASGINSRPKWRWHLLEFARAATSMPARQPKSHVPGACSASAFPILESRWKSPGTSQASVT